MDDNGLPSSQSADPVKPKRVSYVSLYIKGLLIAIIGGVANALFLHNNPYGYGAVATVTTLSLGRSFGRFFIEKTQNVSRYRFESGMRQTVASTLQSKDAFTTPRPPLTAEDKAQMNGLEVFAYNHHNLVFWGSIFIFVLIIAVFWYLSGLGSQI